MSLRGQPAGLAAGRRREGPPQPGRGRAAAAYCRPWPTSRRRRRGAGSRLVVAATSTRGRGGRRVTGSRGRADPVPGTSRRSRQRRRTSGSTSSSGAPGDGGLGVRGPASPRRTSRGVGPRAGALSSPGSSSTCGPSGRRPFRRGCRRRSGRLGASVQDHADETDHGTPTAIRSHQLLPSDGREQVEEQRDAAPEPTRSPGTSGRPRRSAGRGSRGAERAVVGSRPVASVLGARAMTAPVVVPTAGRPAPPAGRRGRDRQTEQSRRCRTGRCGASVLRGPRPGAGVSAVPRRW